MKIQVNIYGTIEKQVRKLNQEVIRDGLICKRFDPNVINAEIDVGQHAGVRVLLPRISLSSSKEVMFSYKLNRTQFLVRLSFAMTINKAQGQAIPNVDVYLSDSVFSQASFMLHCLEGSHVQLQRWPSRATLGRLLPHTRGLGFKPRREGFPSGAKNEWGLSFKAKTNTQHTPPNHNHRRLQNQMVSDLDLVNRLHECLKTSDLTTTTTATVRKQLEQDFGIDLTDKKKFIREQVDLYLQNQSQNDDQEQEDVNIDEQDEEVQDDDEEASNGKKKGSKKENKEVKKKGGGFTKLCSLSPQLQKFTGVPELARTEVVKQLWSYIREHDLQDPANRRNIRCDGQFRELFDVDTIDMFQMNKALAKHIWPLNSDGAPVTTTPKEKKPKKKEREEDSEEPKRKEKRQKGAGSSGSSGILAPIPLSEALVKFLGTGENALARSDVVKRIWDYIKQNNLQDPSDKRRILCDDKLKELFDVDTFIGFGVSKLLAPHFIKTESSMKMLKTKSD
nr:hypothetical protein [Tanacetum cinerariifolium]